MPDARPPQALSEALDAAWTALQGSAPQAELLRGPGAGAPDFAVAAERAKPGAPVFVVTSAAAAVEAYGELREHVVRPRANVKIVAWEAAGSTDRTSAGVDDLGVLRGLPGLTIVVPADGPTVRTAVPAIAAFDGPVYVRLALGSLPTVTDGSFLVGRAPALRDGSDLTLVAIGPMVSRALAVATELAAVGVSARVLDFASFKPHDTKAVLRAARETGALLTLEDHSTLTGLGALIASVVAEEAPVPVRRVGLPDLFGTDEGAGSALERPGLSLDRCLEEAWTVLRAKGKVQ
jgi:transketolase